MRTDSTRISDTAKAEAHEYIEEKYGKEYIVNEVKQAKNQRNAQDAHEAIRPTSAMRTPDELKAIFSS